MNVIYVIAMHSLIADKTSHVFKAAFRSFRYWVDDPGEVTLISQEKRTGYRIKDTTREDTHGCSLGLWLSLSCVVVF